MSIFTEESGKYSSNRAMGILYMVVLLALYCYKEIKDLVIQSPEIFIGMVVTAASLLGIKAVVSSFKRSSITPPPGTPPKGDDPNQ